MQYSVTSGVDRPTASREGRTVTAYVLSTPLVASLAVVIADCEMNNSVVVLVVTTQMEYSSTSFKAGNIVYGIVLSMCSNEFVSSFFSVDVGRFAHAASDVERLRKTEHCVIVIFMW